MAGSDEIDESLVLDERTGIRGDNLVEAKRRDRLQAKRSTSRRFTVFNLLANVLLALGKGAVGLLTGSLAVMADAVNSLADTAYSLVLLVGMHFSLQPADRSHPQGHRGLEPLLSLAIGVSVAVVAYELFSRGVRGLLDPPPVERSVLAILVLLAAMAVKAWVFLRARRDAREIHSPALQAVSTDAAADILASAAALAGYLGAQAGVIRADAVFSLVVALFVARTAYEVLWENVGYITGRGAPPELQRQVLDLACRWDMVHAVHDLKAYFRGPELHVSFHIEIDREETLDRVHDMEQSLRLALLDIPEIDEVSLHMDPVDAPGDGSVCVRR
jgi:cation diffusion facilitator family transporter